MEYVQCMVIMPAAPPQGHQQLSSIHQDCAVLHLSALQKSCKCKVDSKQTMNTVTVHTVLTMSQVSQWTHCTHKLQVHVEKFAPGSPCSSDFPCGYARGFVLISAGFQLEPHKTTKDQRCWYTGNVDDGARYAWYSGYTCLY